VLDKFVWWENCEFKINDARWTEQNEKWLNFWWTKRCVILSLEAGLVSEMRMLFLLLVRALLRLAFVVYFQKSLNSKSLKKAELLVRCLVVICRNFDNIPLIASCDYVKQSVGIAATIVHHVRTPQHGYYSLDICDMPWF